MGILQRFLTDIIKSARSQARNESVEPVRATDGLSAKVAWPTGSRPGMKVVILNWAEGENDPFSCFNATLKRYFQACGKDVEIIQIGDPDSPRRLMELGPPIEFAFTWQGIGSWATLDNGESLWDCLKIPLICVHGDHPSHCPPNHQFDSRYCIHLYGDAEFSIYSNRHFRRDQGAGIIDLPLLFDEKPLTQRVGDWFVMVKNVNDPATFEGVWRQELDKATFDVYMMAMETLKQKISTASHVDIHHVLDELIFQNGVDWLRPESNFPGYHRYHSMIDHQTRCYKSILALTSIRDFPVRVYGRGWEGVAKTSPPGHVFLPARDMAASQDMYYTRYGLVDISPASGLHDRTHRALSNRSAFLSSANVEDIGIDGEQFGSLFFNFAPGNLAEKCAAVVADPEAHLGVSQQFAHDNYNKARIRDFVSKLELLARTAKGFSIV